jgi:hypothetical protein
MLRDIPLVLDALLVNRLLRLDRAASELWDAIDHIRHRRDLFPSGLAPS